MTAQQLGAQRFLTWLADAAPEISGSLGPPASAAVLAALVETCGELPTEFLAFYRAHDGQRGEDVCFVPAYYLLDAAMIVEIWKDQQTYDAFEWPPAWIPFARFDCDYLCLDARTGHVFEFFLKFPDRPRIAHSFDDFLARIQAAVSTGEFRVGPEGLEQDRDADLAWAAAWEQACAS